jgi:hypothetical protein
LLFHPHRWDEAKIGALNAHSASPAEMEFPIIGHGYSPGEEINHISFGIEAGHESVGRIIRSGSFSILY